MVTGEIQCAKRVWLVQVAEGVDNEEYFEHFEKEFNG